jgi:hypothetical protein
MFRGTPPKNSTESKIQGRSRDDIERQSEGWKHFPFGRHAAAPWQRPPDCHHNHTITIRPRIPVLAWFWISLRRRTCTDARGFYPFPFDATSLRNFTRWAMILISHAAYHRPPSEPCPGSMLKDTTGSGV